MKNDRRDREKVEQELMKEE